MTYGRLDKSQIAREALDRIGKLYDIERKIAGKSAEMRHATRQKYSAEKVVAFKAWAEQQLTRIPGKSDLAKAFRYALNRWSSFTLFLKDGRVAIDNNPAERALRPIGDRMEKLALRRIGHRRRNPGPCDDADREREDQRPRSAGALSRRRARPNPRSQDEPS